MVNNVEIETRSQTINQSGGKSPAGVARNISSTVFSSFDLVRDVTFTLEECRTRFSKKEKKKMKKKKEKDKRKADRPSIGTFVYFSSRFRGGYIDKAVRWNDSICYIPAKLKSR